MSWFSNLCRLGETDCPSKWGSLFGHRILVGYFDRGEIKPFRVTGASLLTARYVVAKHSNGSFYASEFCERCGKIGKDLYGE